MNGNTINDAKIFSSTVYYYGGNLIAWKSNFPFALSQNSFGLNTGALMSSINLGTYAILGDVVESPFTLILFAFTDTSTLLFIDVTANYVTVGLCDSTQVNLGSVESYWQSSDINQIQILPSGGNPVFYAYDLADLP